MGSLFTTSDGKIITDIPSGMLHLDFLNGTCIDSAGTITQMNTNLNYYNLHAVVLLLWCSYLVIFSCVLNWFSHQSRCEFALSLICYITPNLHN